MWKIFVTWSFQTPTTHTVSFNLSNTLSVSQALLVSQALSLSLSNTLKVQTPKSLKRSPSNAHRPRSATKLPSPSNTLPFPQTTFRRSPHPSLEITQTLAVLGVQRNYRHRQTLSPFLRPHSDDPFTHPLKIPFVPTNGSPDFALFEGMFFLKKFELFK